MASDLDFRPEALDVGDEIRWYGRWFTIRRKQRTATSTVFDLTDELTVFYRPGCWVAARPLAREDAS